ncbi:MAG: ATP-binding cassette domain-containing protein, partial [Deltaproteobacteria bacterium]
HQTCINLVLPLNSAPWPAFAVHHRLMSWLIAFAFLLRGGRLDTPPQVFPYLKARQGQLARTLSGGERQMLAMGRSLMARPKLCMFDEPSYGLAPLMVKELFKIITVLNEQGITILLVEQNIRNALEIADRAYLLENGRIVLEGARELFLHSDYVKKAYLGL